MKNEKLKKVAFLWDESFLWGIMAYKTLKSLNLPFDLISSGDIKAGELDNYKMLFVPGGWASNKNRVLGETGRKAVQDFVAGGGSYLGFCGGAGLAIKASDCIGLLNIKRKPTKERVPSFSGRINLNLNEHQIWNLSLVPRPSSLVFNAWWPSQFIIEDNNIKVLATCCDALPDSFSSDLNVGDVDAGGSWNELEKIYQINLNPKRLINEPAVIEGAYGKGKVILSLIHFDTPDDTNGRQVLKNMWRYLSQPLNFSTSHLQSGPRTLASASRLWRPNSELISELYSLCSDLITLGQRNFLWFWRNPMLLQWRRGIRGLEYNTLYIMIREIAERQSKEQRAKMKDNKRQKTEDRRQSTDKDLKKIRELLIPFIEKAKRLLILERLALQKGHITYERCGEPEIQKIRTELFSGSKSHGGLFKELIDEIDILLFSLKKQE